MTFINFFSLSSKGCCIYPCSPACQNKVKKFINFGYYTINIWYQYVFVLQRDELFRAQNRTINYQNSVLISVSIHFVFRTILCTNHWTEVAKFFSPEKPLCPSTITLWDTTAAIWLYKWRYYYLWSSQCHCLTTWKRL